MHPAMAAHTRGITPNDSATEAEAKKTARLLASAAPRDDEVSALLRRSIALALQPLGVTQGRGCVVLMHTPTCISLTHTCPRAHRSCLRW